MARKGTPFTTRQYSIPEVGKVWVKLPTKFKGPQTKHVAAIIEAASNKKLKSSSSCPVIMFKAQTQSPVAVQRCDSSTFFSRTGKNSFSAKQAARAKRLCKSGKMTAKQKRAFKHCRK